MHPKYDPKEKKNETSNYSSQIYSKKQYVRPIRLKLIPRESVLHPWIAGRHLSQRLVPPVSKKPVDKFKLM